MQDEPPFDPVDMAEMVAAILENAENKKKSADNFSIKELQEAVKPASRRNVCLERLLNKASGKSNKIKGWITPCFRHGEYFSWSFRPMSAR